MAELRRTNYRSRSGRGRETVQEKRRKKRPVFYICLFFLLAVLAAGAFLAYRKFGPGRVWADYRELYGAGAEETVVFLDGIQSEGRSVSRNGRIYAPVSGNNGSRWYYSGEGLLLYSTAEETVVFEPGAQSYTMGGTTVDTGYEIFFAENGAAYVAADFMAEFEGVRTFYFPPDKEEGIPGRLYVESVGTQEEAKASGSTQVRVLAGIKSPIVAETWAGETLTVMDHVDDWTRVRTEDGFVGYLKTKHLEDVRQVQVASPLPEYTSIQMDEKVCMAWHQVFSAADNGELSYYLEGTSGINVLSPTWFSVSDNAGSLSSLADQAYVEEAHSRGIQVWALVDDFNTDMDDLTMLSSSAARENVIRRLMEEAALYDIDGINVDFESVDEACAPHFLQFIRELSIACRKAGKVLSIDNYVPSGGRSWYDLGEQGEVADYVVIMGYDEHYKGCCSGTNASLSFSEHGITATLEEVPADKVINGLPFFMRLWKETPQENAGADEELYNDGLSVYDGPYARDSEAIGMREAQELIEAHGVSPQWQEDLGQYYVQYEEEGSTYRIWVEDAASIGLKMEKVQQHGIAGAAFWKLGLETPDVWPVIEEYLE